MHGDTMVQGDRRQRPRPVDEQDMRKPSQVAQNGYISPRCGGAAGGECVNSCAVRVPKQVLECQGTRIPNSSNDDDFPSTIDTRTRERDPTQLRKFGDRAPDDHSVRRSQTNLQGKQPGHIPSSDEPPAYIG